MGELYDQSISKSDKEAFWKKIVDSESVDATEVVKQCCSKDGIPDKCRKTAWRFLLSKQLDEESSNTLGAYEELAATDDSELKDVIADIDADLEHCQLEDEDAKQAVLRFPNLPEQALMTESSSSVRTGISLTARTDASWMKCALLRKH